MSSPLLAQLNSLPARDRTFREGEFLFHREDKVRSMYFIVSGEVHLMRHHENGDPIVLHRAGPGAMLAEASLFSERYHCDAMARTATETRRIQKGALRAYLGRRQDFAEAIAMHLAREVHNARLRAELLSLKTVSERLDAWLTWNDNQLPEKGSWKTVAWEIGTSPEALYRELAKRRQP